MGFVCGVLYDDGLQIAFALRIFLFTCITFDKFFFRIKEYDHMLHCQYRIMVIYERFPTSNEKFSDVFFTSFV